MIAALVDESKVLRYIDPQYEDGVYEKKFVDRYNSRSYLKTVWVRAFTL